MPAEHGGEGLEDGFMGELMGEAWPASNESFLLSIIPPASCPPSSAGAVGPAVGGTKG